MLPLHCSSLHCSSLCCSSLCVAAPCVLQLLVLSWQDCGADAHPHVPTCPDNTVGQGHYASEAQYTQMMSARVAKVLRAYLRGLSAEQRQHALEVTTIAYPVYSLPSL